MAPLPLKSFLATPPLFDIAAPPANATENAAPDEAPSRLLNIAFFCDAYFPTRNGVAVSVETTAEELRARGHRVAVFAPRYKNHRDENESDIVRFPAGHWARARDFPVAFPLLPRASFRVGSRFRREEFDIVHSHSPFTIGTTGARWARRNDIPLLFTFHTLYHRYLHYVPMPHDWTRSSIVWWLRYYCNLCDGIIAPSQPVAQIAAHLAPDVPRRVLPTGVDVAHFASGAREATRARLGFAASTRVLLYVGRMVQEKNLVFLLRALAPLLKENQAPPTHLLLVGGGPDLPRLREIAVQMGIAARVTFTDFVAPASTRDLYAAADIFVFASRTETQGVSIAEALSSGLPCVVVGAMGAAEAVTNGADGFIVPPRETDFTRAVDTLLHDEKLRLSMAACARKNAPALSRTRAVDHLVALYSHHLNVAAKR